MADAHLPQQGRSPIDVTDATFQTAVLERSNEVPVVVDLWAPWCGPCKTLGPILEDVIAATGGKVELVKVNVDENPQVSQAFQAQSIPAVYAMRDGKVVDGFVGAQPEATVRQLVEGLLLSPDDDEVSRLVTAGDEASLRSAVEIEPDSEPALVALAELLVADGRTEEALAFLERIPESAETRRVAARARLGSTAEAAGPDGDVSARLDTLLDRVKDDDDARQEFVDLLEVLGPDDPRTAGYRKALTARLY
ncbi:MAG TPA: thioredoxin [Acidimicrobiales bacterium]|nr:thioredoxin [Acidimicrobiales bacterium]